MAAVEISNLSRLAMDSQQKAREFPADSAEGIWYRDQADGYFEAAQTEMLNQYRCKTPDCPNYAIGQEFCERCQDEVEQMPYPLANTLLEPLFKVSLMVVVGIAMALTAVVYFVVR